MSCQVKILGAVSLLIKPALAAVITVLVLVSGLAAAGTLPEIRSLAADQHYAEALKQLDAYLENHAGDVEARLFRGVILTRQGNIDEAIATFDQLSKDRPELPEPLNNLAVLYAAQGRYDDSRKVLQRAIELEPRYDTAHENLGDVYAKLANIAYERAFTLNKKNSSARDKASWMTRVLDTEPAAPGEVSPGASAQTSDLETRAAEQVEPQARSEAETRAVARQIAATCYAVNGIENHASARSVANWFTTRGLTAREQTRSAQESIFYEVYAPPLNTRAAVDEEMRRMREDGFVDIMRINSGELENGISVGAYRQLSNAERRVKNLRAKGYQVEFKPRDKTRTTYWVAVGAGANREMRSQFTSTFPAYPLSESPCR
jgi:tetratricopeptide (TPR) repeat protein